MVGVEGASYSIYRVWSQVTVTDKVRFEMSMETMVDRFSAFYRTVPQKSRGKGIGRLA